MKLPAVNCRVSSGIAPKPTHLRSMSYGAVASPSSLGTELLAKADHPCSKLQGILAKANNLFPFAISQILLYLPSRKASPYHFLSFHFFAFGKMVNYLT